MTKQQVHDVYEKFQAWLKEDQTWEQDLDGYSGMDLAHTSAAKLHSMLLEECGNAPASKPSGKEAIEACKALVQWSEAALDKNGDLGPLYEKVIPMAVEAITAHQADEEICAWPGCMNRIDNGEGYDGYCGTCADKLENEK